MQLLHGLTSQRTIHMYAEEHVIEIDVVTAMPDICVHCATLQHRAVARTVAEFGAAI